MEVLIDCKNLCFSYAQKEVLKDLSFQVLRGGIYGLLGKNGAGKTTTINMLMGNLVPSSGYCHVFTEPSHRLKPSTRQRIALLHEGFTQYDFMSIAELERFYRGMYPQWRRDLFFELITKLDVPLNRRLSKMSYGQRSQVCLGLLMAQSPELMVLDDYSMGLDAGYRHLFLEYLEAYVREVGTTVLLTSHVVHDLERIMDHMLIIQKGSLLYSSSKEDFFGGLSQWQFCRSIQADQLDALEPLIRVEHIGKNTIVTSFESEEEVRSVLKSKGVPLANWRKLIMDFESSFLSLIGKY